MNEEVTKVKCPICGEEMTPKGLYGHLRFKHGKTGKKLNEIYGANLQAKEQEMMTERISELHDELMSIRKKQDELEKQDRSSWFATDEAVKKLKKLYNAQEKRIKDELNKLLQEVGSEAEDDW